MFVIQISTRMKCELWVVNLVFLPSYWSATLSLDLAWPSVSFVPKSPSWRLTLAKLRYHTLDG